MTNSHETSPAGEPVENADGSPDTASAWTREESDAWSRRLARSPLNDEDPSSGDMQLEERTALRRVAGLSTELTDVTEVEYRQLRLERVVLVGVWTTGTAAQAESSMTELAALAETAGSEVLEALMHRRDKPDAATFIG